MKKINLKKVFAVLLSLGMGFSIASCGVKEENKDKTPEKTPTSEVSKTPEKTPSKEVVTPTPSGEVSKLEELSKKYNCITIARAIELATAAGTTETTDKYYVCGIIQSVSKPQYGEMTITDGTNSIYVFGTQLADGTYYSDMQNKPVAGDVIVLQGSLKTYKETPELGKSNIIEFYHEQPKEDNTYTKMSVNAARSAEKGTKVSITGVVAKITLANGKIPNGFYVIDETGSIYVYGEAAQQVSVGNKVTVEATKDLFIASTEQSYAEKTGYKGSIQLSSPKIVSNDSKTTNEFPKDSITDITVKELMETSFDTNITNIVYKTYCLVKKAQGDGFVNYYLDDIDGKTGSYVYTQCNGSDLDYLEPFDGKVCEVYFTAINCKSSASGSVYRLMPISVKDVNYQYDESKACDDALTYFGLTQFKVKEYEADPELALLDTCGFEVFNLTGIKLSYTSSNEEVFKIDATSNTLRAIGYGQAKITVTATYKTYTASKEVTLVYKKSEVIDSITVAEAIKATIDSTVTVKGIVGTSLVNQSQGFYLMDSTGTIAVKLTSGMDTLAISDEIIITGKRVMYGAKDSAVGQSAIIDAVILSNKKGNHDLPFANLITDKTITDICKVDTTTDLTTNLYKVTATVKKYETKYATTYNLYLGENYLSLYSSSGNQYAWLDNYLDKEVTVIVALCNWNGKTTYRGCVLSITLNGVTAYNTLNFNK